MRQTATRANFLTAAQIAELLECSKRTAARMIGRGDFPGAFQVSDAPNSAFLVPLTEVQAYLKKRAQESKDS